MRYFHFIAAAAAVFSSGANAHVTLENEQATAGSYYKAVLKVPHGCDGQATTRLRVRIPEGVSSVKPMLKPNWKVQIMREKLAKPITDEHGRTTTEVVKEVVWAGGPLPNDYYDEFIMQVKLPDSPNSDLYFPTIQECGKTLTRWIEIPAKGGAEPKEPAPKVRLVPKAAGAH